MQFVWKSIGYMFWKHRHLEEHLCKLFPVDCLHSPLLEHDLYNPNYHQQIMVSTFVFEDNKIWSDFLEYKKGTYPKQKQRTHGFDFIPKHGLAPNVSTADAKEIGGAKQKKIVGKPGKRPPFSVIVWLISKCSLRYTWAGCLLPLFVSSGSQSTPEHGCHRCCHTPNDRDV
jgi:hypothetical protein